MVQNDIIATTESWFAKVPSLPSNIRAVLVQVAPYIALIFGILGVLSSIAGLGILTIFSPFAFMMGPQGPYGGGMLAALLWLVSSVLMLVAFPGLQKRSLQGWNMLFWSEVVSVVGSLVTLNILSGLVSAFIGLYLLFQIKSYYK